LLDVSDIWLMNFGDFALYLFSVKRHSWGRDLKAWPSN